MPRTVDHIVETHQLAQSRRAAGRPVWEHKIVAQRDDDDFEWTRDRFAEALKISPWMRASIKAAGDKFDSELWQLWDEIKDAEDERHFNGVLDAIYDLADLERCWITFEYRR